VIDSHCHLDSERFHEDREAVIERALAAGVTRMLTIGSGDGPPDLECAVRLADAHEAVYATVGVHPHDASKTDPATLPALRELLKHPKVLALGEIGLDYHYDFSPRDVQQRVFIEQMQLAAEARKPVVIHTREAWDDTFRLIGEYWRPTGLGGVMHCFSGGPAEAERALKLGFHLSFGGIVTFPNARSVQQAAQLCPEDRLLIETDAPFLAPVPHRGQRNEPAFVVHTAARLAALRGAAVEQIDAATTRNFLAWAKLQAG
jgi:TatD DNase family protein